MEPIPSSLAGFRGTRGELLVALKRAQPVTAEEMAGGMGVTPNALRRHLKELEGEGLVRFQPEARTVGRPAYAYSLTDAGEALFPRAYDAALAQVLEQVREQLGPAGVVAIFARQWAEVAEEAKAAMATLPMPERAQLLAELLTSRGYMAEAETRPDGEARIREHNCVLKGIVERFPEVCAAEALFLEDVLGASVERHAHIASGANCCEYCVGKPVALQGHR